MIEPFSIMTALGVFMAYLTIDWLFTEYTLSIVELKPFKAASVGGFIYLLSAYGVINFVANPVYVAAMVAGGWLGTYLSVWLKKEKNNEVA